MTSRFLSVFSIQSLLILVILLGGQSAHSSVNEISYFEAYAANGGDIARSGLFQSDSTIDLIYHFELDSDRNQTAQLTWDVYSSYERLSYSGDTSMDCQPGSNTLRVADAIPVDLGTGTQSYDIYASINVDGEKADTEFEIRVESPISYPGLIIEDVRLELRDDDSPIAEEMRRAAIPYTLEIDFRCENIISYAHAQIRWYGATVDGYELDNGIGTLHIEEGFNTFTVDSYIARPTVLARPQADFSVEINVFGYIDTVTFPISTLPISLMELRAESGVEDEVAFSVGEAFLVTEDGGRATFFSKNEPIMARLLTGGTIPEDATVYMDLSGGPGPASGVDDSTEEFMVRLESGTESPQVDFALPGHQNRTPGAYNFTWTVVIGEVLFAERSASLTISGRQGIEIPVVIELPGNASFTVPLTWDVTRESGSGLLATMLTPDGAIIRLLAQDMDDPVKVETMADIFESSRTVSGIPSDATLLTSESSELEGMMESLNRAYLGGGKVFVNDYWVYRAEAGQYVFLTTTAVANEDDIAAAYEASEAIRLSVDLGF